jgi:hypothetical protein
MTPRAAGVLGALLLGLGALTVTWNVNIPSLRRLERDVAWTTGSVVAREPQNHDSVIAQYVVDGRTYRVETSFALEEPGRLIANEIFAVSLAALGGAVAGFIVLGRAVVRSSSPRTPGGAEQSGQR